jgi:hypothetical protein
MAAMPASTMPMIGASGAIAGAMGAFLVSFARTRIRFFYFFVRFGTFTAPAFVMLPLWIAQEVLFAVLSGGQDGVAHWAHVGGFAYGVVFALGMRFTGLEARLDRTLERKVSVTQDERIMRAAEMTTQGQSTSAVALLCAVAVERPDDVDVYLEMLRATQSAGDFVREGEAYAHLVRIYLDLGLPDTASELLREATQRQLADRVPMELQRRLAERLGRPR